jgi:hypothetical protein
MVYMEEQHIENFNGFTRNKMHWTLFIFELCNRLVSRKNIEINETLSCKERMHWTLSFSYGAIHLVTG